MNASSLKTFVDGVSNFFDRLGSEKVAVGVPYIKDAGSYLGEITGIIGLTGARKGGILISCSYAMIDAISAAYTGIADASNVARIDMAGELANTISGNASEAFGTDFQISVPVVITGRPQGISLPTKLPTYVIPLDWKGETAHLIVGIE